MFKVNNEDTRTTLLTSSCVPVVEFEHISHLFVISQWLTLSNSLFAGKT